jgi:predicted nucleotidyltransferase
VTSRRVGSARLVSANRDARHYGAVSEIVLAAFGLPAVIAEEFCGLAAVHAVVLFGSWAARAAGEEGPAPGDLDVLVVGDPDRAEVHAAAARAQERLGLEVHATIRSLTEWTAGEDPFLIEVRRRPHEVLCADDSHSPTT